jgi:glycerophosphoryl diester phosphodiesterase
MKPRLIPPRSSRSPRPSACCCRPPAPVVIAHRGASGYLPEHTLEAKAWLTRLGADFIEQDLVLTKDDVPVVLHDIYLDTVTDVARNVPRAANARDGRFYAIDFTVAELKTLRVSERFNAKTGKPVYPKRFPDGGCRNSASPRWRRNCSSSKALNRSTGRNVGHLPGDQAAEVAPRTRPRHQPGRAADSRALRLRDQGRRLFPPVLRVHRGEAPPRNELGWQGRLVLLVGAAAKEADGTDNAWVCSPAGIKAIAPLVDGIGPAIGRIVTWPGAGAAPKFTELVRLAHAAKLVVHPYTIRSDDLPRNCPDVDTLHAALFATTRADGVFSDFTDTTLRWVRRHAGR